MDADPPAVLDAALLAQIAAKAAVRRYPAGAVIINEGDAADALFIVLEGRLKTYASNASGKEVILAGHGPGEYVGELALDGGVRSASVMTVTPARCAVVSGADLRGFIAEHPDFALHLMQNLIRRLRRLTHRVKSLALEDVYGRLAWLLESMAQPEGGRQVIAQKLTQQEIAEHIGASREMVSRVLKELVAGGYVEVAAGRIALLKKLPAGW